MDTIVKQIRLALSSTGERKDELRHFLIALKNLKNMKNKKEYPLAELNEMITILSFSERVKERLRSPYVNVIAIIVAIIFGLMEFF